MSYARTLTSIVLLAFAFASQPASAATRQEIEAFADEALQKLYAESPAARKLAGKARGMLILPRVWKAGFGVGGEGGEGVLRVGGRTVDHYLLTGGSFGLQLGVQRKSVVILFMDAEALTRFRQSEGWKAGVDGSVAIATLGAGGSLDTKTAQEPIIGFVFSNKGLMYNLSLEGTKLTKRKK
jgi:lipid-binding SYLF domain-containing protein